MFLLHVTVRIDKKYNTLSNSHIYGHELFPTFSWSRIAKRSQHYQREIRPQEQSVSAG